MFRTWAFALPAMAVVVAAALVPTVASTADAAPAANPPAACTATTPSVAALTTTLNNVQTALAPTPDPTKLAPVAGDLFNAVLAVQKDGCLPALPTSDVTPPPAPSTSAARPHVQDASDCLADGVQLLSAALGTLSASIASPANPTAVTNALTTLASAVTAINTDSCLPAALPVPSLPVSPPPAP